MMETRNPYMILGIPFGSTREAALGAFARKSRNLRRQGAAGKALMTDLTWALSQVSEPGRDPETEMGVYRIPADPGAFILSGDGVMHPPAETMQRRYTDLAGAEESLRRRATHEYLQYLVLLTAQHTGDVEA